MRKYLPVILLILALAFTVNIDTLANSGWVDQNGNPVSDKDVADAFSQGIMQGVTNMAKKIQPGYRKLMTCSPVSIDDASFHVYGISGNKCHFKYCQYDCALTMDMTRKYAEASLKGVEDALNGNFSTTPKTPHAKYIQSVPDNPSYCKNTGLQWTVEYENE